MSKLISGKEALIALANGEDVEYEVVVGRDVWNKISSMSVNLILADNFKFRLKPRTITINGIEVPAPFEPKDKDVIFYISDDSKVGFHESIWNKRWIEYPAVLGVWRTEEEIKQVVAALRQVFNVQG